MAALSLASTGCIRSIIATGIYAWNGGNVIPAECEALEGQRVVVLCRPPASYEYRNAGAARAIGARVSYMLGENVKKIDVVSPREVDNWVDEQDWENFKDLGRAVKATRVVYIELDDFDLYKGKTLYQGRANVRVSVYDMNTGGKLVWERRWGSFCSRGTAAFPRRTSRCSSLRRSSSRSSRRRSPSTFTSTIQTTASRSTPWRITEAARAACAGLPRGPQRDHSGGGSRRVGPCGAGCGGRGRALPLPSSRGGMRW